MGAHCCQHTPTPSGHNNPAWRRVLWIALVINGVMFATEIIAGLAADSVSLQADALDFFGDSVNYAISLGVAGLALSWRTKAALFKGITIGIFGLFILASTIWHAMQGLVPEAPIMGIVGAVALISNLVVALMLFQFKDGDANMRSVWICSRNDVIGNLAVLIAALGVFGTQTGYPDYLVGFIMASLSISAGWQIIKTAMKEQKGNTLT